jgi:hypothetical protein
VGIHDYDDDLERLARRYATEEGLPHLFSRERPGGRRLALEGHPHTGQPIVLSEFGGIALGDPGSSPNGWGYSCCGQNSVMTDAVVLAALIDDGFDDERPVVSSRN